MGDLREGFEGKQDLKNYVEGTAFLAEEITFGGKVISFKIARWRKVCVFVCVCASMRTGEHICDVQVNFIISLSP